MARSRFALILALCMVAHKPDCFEMYKDMVQILLLFKVLLTQGIEFEDLLNDAPPGYEPSLYFGDYLFSWVFMPVQDDYQHYIVRTPTRLMVL